MARTSLSVQKRPGRVVLKSERFAGRGWGRGRVVCTAGPTHCVGVGAMHMVNSSGENIHNNAPCINATTQCLISRQHTKARTGEGVKAEAVLVDDLPPGDVAGERQVGRLDQLKASLQVRAAGA